MADRIGASFQIAMGSSRALRHVQIDHRPPVCFFSSFLLFKNIALAKETQLSLVS